MKKTITLVEALIGFEFKVKHFDFEFDDEIATAHGVFEEGHTEASNYFLFLIAQDLPFSRVDIENAAIQMLHFELEANQSFH